MIAPTANHLPPVRRVDASAVVSRHAVATRAGLGALVRHARTTRRLPTVARLASAHHALSPALPAPAALRRIVGALAGRLTVVNHPPATTLPHATGALARGLAWAAFFGAAPADGAADATADAPARGPGPRDGRAGRERALVRAWRAARGARADELAWLGGGGASWVASALYEVDGAAVRRADDRRGGAEPATPTFRVELAYRFVVFAGDGPAPAWDALDAAAGRVAAGTAARGDEPPPRPWFAGRLLVADEWATARMPADVRAEWAALTGRGAHADRYWYPESWERFLEPGRVVGCVSAAEVARSRPGRLLGAGEPAPRADAPWAEARPPAPLLSGAARIERGICVPPGYCLLDCLGTLAVELVRV